MGADCMAENKTLLKQIETDLKNGMTYKQIMTKHNLKSNYLIKQVRGLENTCKYFKININIDTLKNLNKSDLTTLYAYIKNMNNILNNRNIEKILKYIINLLEN